MKKLKLSMLVIFFAIASLVNAQSSNPSLQGQEPKCACAQPEFIFSLGGKLQLDYKELKVCTMPDGSLLLEDARTDKYYILSAGVTSGPFEEGDPKLMGFESCYMDDTNPDEQLLRYKGILSYSGGKYLITFKGKNYGPYPEIYDFIVTLSKEKFVLLAAEQEGDIPNLVTNIPNVTFDIVRTLNVWMNGTIKYDDIVVVGNTKIMDLQGKTIFAADSVIMFSERFFMNQANTRYAWYDYGSLNFNDGKSLPDCFNPHFVKTSGIVYLAYMYYSPMKNAIMQCKVPF
ncbi:MAG: hypothetical protein NTW82_11590 [Bacteroidia bacterium]|nr:hypothetical protein [Bacteroidia bacterium]